MVYANRAGEHRSALELQSIRGLAEKLRSTSAAARADKRMQSLFVSRTIVARMCAKNSESGN
jgi:hypothetical protein